MPLPVHMSGGACWNRIIYLTSPPASGMWWLLKASLVCRMILILVIRKSKTENYMCRRSRALGWSYWFRNLIMFPINLPPNQIGTIWFPTNKRECLDHFTCFSFRNLQHIVTRWLVHWPLGLRSANNFRPHQGFGMNNEVLDKKNAAWASRGFFLVYAR